MKLVLKNKWLSVLLSMMLLGGCRTTDVKVNSNVSVPQRFDRAEQARGAMEMGRWWDSWPDPVLRNLITTGLENNHDLAQMKANMNAARAGAALAESDLGPQVWTDVNGSVHRLKNDNPLKNVAIPGMGNAREALHSAGSPLGDNKLDWKGNHIQLGFAASWEPDVFGGKRSDAEAARYLSLSVTEQWHGAQIMLSADIADNYLKMRAMQQRIRIGQQSVTTLKHLLRYAQGRFRAGQATAFDVKDVSSNLAAMQAQIATYQAQADAYQRNLAVLTGQTPQGFYVPESSVDVFQRLPAAPAGQLPLDVITRRPDLRSLENQVKAMSAKLGSAKADRYPRFDISFLWQTGRIKLDSDLSHLKTNGGIVDLGISLPIFTAGRIKHNIEMADSRLKAAIAAYDQGILKALAEVDNAYQMQYSLNKQSLLLIQAQREADKQANAAEKLFRYGDMTLDRALRSRLNAQNLFEKEVQGKLAEAQNLINLYKALGGGWQKDSAEIE